jgi:chondroitin sulfate proteoglycan 4
MLWVSDGQYFVSTELKVRASQPFVRVVNNSGLIVQRGDSGFLSPTNLSVETNLNAFGDDIVYRIIEGPACGQILKDDLPIFSFTDKDLTEESIEYRNNNSAQYKDFIRFSVEVNKIDFYTW